MWTSDRVSAGGVELARHTAGSPDPRAPVLFLLHGLGHWTQAAWDRLVPELDPRWRIVACDLPGFGASARPSGPYDRAFFRRILGAFATDALPPRFALAGHSLGGLLAAELAAEKPARVSHLALLAPLGFARTPRLAARVLAAHLLRRVPWLPIPEALLVRSLRMAVVDPSRLDPAVTAQTRALASDPALVRVYASIGASALGAFTGLERVHRRWSRYDGPVLIAFGAHDRFLPVAASLAAAHRVCPQAERVTCAHSAHLPMIEEPRALGARLRAFLCG